LTEQHQEYVAGETVKFKTHSEKLVEIVDEIASEMNPASINLPKIQQQSKKLKVAIDPMVMTLQSFVGDHTNEEVSKSAISKLKKIASIVSTLQKLLIESHESMFSHPELLYVASWAELI
jgi:aspartate ammonia-lyase